ncbi:elongation factor G [Mucisphaera calidilacus]|uniref:Elongation factor G n=1 Tax=Mucisphaera calidilacus TaxID=2527982 RepID=A0A518BUY1_9BACT|nr:elongation factor G [Mucisphaera calidilacus]QDU70776.1 Elongation factor G [Mucisphaera calidilacus]
MTTYTTAQIRNIVLLGQQGSGKTTLAESLLFSAGAIGRVGAVQDGNTVSDFTDEEKEHGHSLFATLVSADHDGVHLNLLDTPGSPDFMGQAISALPAADTAALVLDAGEPIGSVSRRLMAMAEEQRLCRMVIINKIDHAPEGLASVLEQVQKVFGKRCLPMNLPAEGGKKVVDCFFETEGESDLGPVEDAHTAIIDQVVEIDEDLMSVYLEQGHVKPEQLHDAFEQALREGHLVPVCFVAARPHEDHENPVGVKELVRVLEKLAPSPIEGNPRPFLRGDDTDHEIFADHDPEKHVLAHVFQVRIDPFVGKICLFRVHQGTVTGQSQLFIGDPKTGESKKPFKIGHLQKVQGSKHSEIEQAIPGDLVAVAKIEDIHFDAVLHDSHDEDRLHLRPLRFPEPLTGLAVSPKKRGDEQKIGDALSKLQEEDPTFTVTRDATTHETVIHGLGELQLRVVLEELKNRYNVEVDTKTPRIAYRETISSKAEGHHRHKKQTGGAGQFGEVFLRIEPLERGTGFEFVNDTFGGSIPHQFLPAIEKGIRQALEEGVVAGYPMQDIRVSVYDGKHHPVDSKEVAFITAGKRAFAEAVANASPVLLEPMVDVEVTAPEGYLGDITGDLSSKRGRVQGTDMVGSGQMCISALVPLAEVANYQSELRSMTGGQGSYTMSMSHYDPMPAHVQEKVAAESQKELVEAG